MRPSTLTTAALTALLALPVLAEANARPGGPKSSRKSKRASKRGRKPPTARPTKSRGSSRRNTAPAANATPAVQQMLGPEAIAALAAMTPADHVELRADQLVDGNAFFLVSGWVSPRAVPAFGIEPMIATNDTPLHIMYPTMGLQGESLIVECAGDLSGHYEVNVGELETLGDWSTSAEVGVQAKDGKIKFHADTTYVAPGKMLGLSISKVRRIKKGEALSLFGVPVIAKQDSVSHSSITISKCTIDKLAL